MTDRRGKKSSSVRDRVPGIQKQNGNSAVRKVEAAMNVATEEGQLVEPNASKKRTLATVADYLAAQLHEAQGNIMDLRTQAMSFRQVLLQKDQVILNLEKKILQLESREVEKLKEQLRDDHGLTFGRTMEKNDETGEIFWVDTEEATSA